VYVIATASPWRLIVTALKARLGGVDAASRLERRAGETFVVGADRGSLPIALDGEPIELRAPLEFLSRAGALRVLASRDRPEPLEADR
jgi:diacylglycerol kinase family enzyme